MAYEVELIHFTYQNRPDHWSREVIEPLPMWSRSTHFGRTRSDCMLVLASHAFTGFVGPLTRLPSAVVGTTAISHQLHRIRGSLSPLNDTVTVSL
jgi:hypothetical protein